MKQLLLILKTVPKGQSLAEYGLVLALVAVVAIGGLEAMGKAITGMLSGLSSEISSAVSTANGGQLPKAR